MSRFFRIVFSCCAALLLGYAVLFGMSFGGSVLFFLHSKVIWACVAAAVLLVVAGWRFPLRVNLGVFMLMLSLVGLELLLQATAWLGILPGVSTKLRAPFARVYWRAEGCGNGIRNRFGWYFPEFDLKAARKIAYIGDSQVEAVEVSRNQNQAADLQKLLKQKSPDRAVLGLGTHGTCPAHSMETLEYAWRHFQPQDAIVVVSIGSDVTEASSKLNYVPPNQYIYYDLNTNGDLILRPGSEVARAAFDQNLEFPHQSLLKTLPVILYSYCMTLQTIDSVRDYFYMRRRMADLVARGDAETGFNPEPFAVNPSPEARRAMDTLIAQLAACKKICDSHNMKFHVVTIPVFPRPFYETQHGTNWTTRVGDYDYSGPERKIVDWADKNQIPVVSIGEIIREKNLSVDEIRSLFFSNGTGHLTPKGHALCAEAVYDRFYAANFR